MINKSCPKTTKPEKVQAQTAFEANCDGRALPAQYVTRIINGKGRHNSSLNFYLSVFSQTCIKRPPKGLRKNGLLRQVAY